MIRYGALADKMRPLAKEDLFVSRLKLLIVMAKSVQQKYPLGRYRKTAVEETANTIFYEALHRAAQFGCSTGEASCEGSDGHSDKDHFIWLQRIQLLAVMIKSMIQGNPMGDYRDKALAENLDRICEQITQPLDLSQVPFLKVA